VILAALALLAAQPVTVNDDGGWCWFQDERALIHQGKLIFASAASGARDPSRRGNIEVTTYDFKTGSTRRSTLHSGFVNTPDGQYDDHNVAALAVAPDGRLLAVYSRHASENAFYYRLSERAGDAASWGGERIVRLDPASRVTYSNLHYLPAEKRIYNFFRGYLRNKPSWAYSDDGGESWTAGGIFIDVPVKFAHRPYVRYASNGRDTVHIFYTNGHPRDYDNSTYHIFYRAGKLHRSDGTVIRTLQEGLKEPEEGTRIFHGDPNNVAWVSDIHLDAGGRPYVAYSIQKDSARIASGTGGADHRYRYARWNGSAWQDHEIAFAGTRLYAGEDDYTGNIALDPDNPGIVYISTNADPASGKPLISSADGRRHWEIFRGATSDSGTTWQWTPLTQNSTTDNIRPLAPRSDGKHSIVLWLRGRYTAYTNYDLSVVGMPMLR
jgi:hypothetical protein